MFPRSARLTGKGARFVVRRGNSIASNALRLKWAISRTPSSRATIVVGLAVDKRSTERNLIKRRIREALRPLLSQLRPPANLMVFTNKGVLGKSFQDLQKEIISLLKRAHLL